MATLRELIKDYQKVYPNLSDDWMDDCKRQKKLSDAVILAVSARTEKGKKHPHQYRLVNKVMKMVAGNLNSRRDLKTAKDFDSLLQIVDECKESGFGQLAIYDTALRLGWRFDLLPEKVYLHAGTRAGAQNLALALRLALRRDDVLLRGELPPELQEMEPKEVEVFFCVYKDDLKKVGTDEPFVSHWKGNPNTDCGPSSKMRHC